MKIAFKKKFSSYFDGMSDKDWSSFYTKFSSREDIRSFKKLIQDEAEKRYMAIKINVSPVYAYIDAYKLNRYVLNIPNSDISFLKKDGKIVKLISAVERLPNNSHKLHSSWVQAYIYGNESYLVWTRGRGVAYKQVVKYIEWKIEYDEVIKFFENPDDYAISHWGLGSSGTFSGGKEVGTYYKVNLDLYKKALWMIGKKFIKQTIASYTPSIRKWSKISPAYIKKMDFRPLLDKSVTAPSKAKVMVIHDCSGSMGNGGTWSIAHKAVSFIGALVNSGVVDVTHAIYHSSYWWMDMKKRITEGDICHYHGCDEGFKYIDDNLPSEWIKEVDYVVVTTDLRYDNDEKQWLVDYLKRAPAHIVLSFSNYPSITWLKSKQVNDIQDMVKAVMKMNSKA